MSREYRDLLVKAAPEGEELEEKAGRGRGLLPRGGMMAGASRMERDMNKRVKRNPKMQSARKRKVNMAFAKREFSAIGRLRRRALSRVGR